MARPRSSRRDRGGSGASVPRGIFHFPREPQIASHLLVAGIPEQRRFRRRADAMPSDGRHGAAAKQRGDVEMHAIHKPPVEGFTEHPPPAFEEDAGDFAATECAQDGAQALATEDERAVAVGVGEKVRAFWQIAAARDDDPPRLARAGDAADGQARVVGAESLRADEDSIDLRAQAHGIGARGGAGQPLAFARRAGETAVERHSGLGDDERHPRHDPLVKRRIQLAALAFQNPRRDREPRRPQQPEAAARVRRIWIGRADDHARKTRADDRLHARRRAPVGGARFERHVNRRAPREGRILQRAQRLDLRVRLPGALVKTARQHPPAAHNDRADRGIRAGLAEPARRFTQSCAHVFLVVHARGLSLARGSLNPELRAVSLSLREKQSLYHSLGQLVRSGVPLPSALDNLARTTRGGMRSVVRRLKDAIGSGQTVGESFARQRPAVGEMEIGVIAAVERAGKLEQGLAQLAEYFGALDRARAGLLKKCAYPAFVLHFGVFVMSLTTLMTRGLVPYLRETFGLLALLYGVALVIALLVPLLRDAGSTSALLDGLLRTLPLVGKIRRALSTARFCATYGMQLDAGINVIDALQAAQRASHSGVIRAAVERAVPEVRGGAQVGGLLAAGRAFPEPMIRSFCIGEQTGEIDQELKRMAAEYQAEGLARIETLAEWLSRFFYIAILAYIGYGVVSWYQGYLHQAMSIIDSN